MISASTVLSRFLVRSAAISEDKLKEIMLKIRKRAVSSLNWKQLQAVLAVLDPGWEVEPIVGLIKLYGTESHPDNPEWYTGNKNAVEAKHRETAPRAVTSLPSSPRHGQLYVLDLTPIRERPEHGGWEFTAKPWMGGEGWRIVAPDRTSFDVLPGQYDFGTFYHGYKEARKRSRLSLWDAIRWLNEKTDWLDQINKKLGLGVFEESVPRTRESTGSCPVCFQNIKARPSMAFHGYKRPGGGSTHGSCFGVGYLPFEVSVEGTKDYLEKVITPQYEETLQALKQLKSGKVTSLVIRRGKKTITPDDPEWERSLKYAIEDTERGIKRLQGTLEAYTNLVRRWKERPLPKEGEPHIDWYHKGQK